MGDGVKMELKPGRGDRGGRLAELSCPLWSHRELNTIITADNSHHFNRMRSDTDMEISDVKNVMELFVIEDYGKTFLPREEKHDKIMGSQSCYCTLIY